MQSLVYVTIFSTRVHERSSSNRLHKNFARGSRTNHRLDLSCVFLSNCAKDKTMGPVKVYS